jgi:hypothetical protein
MLKIPLDIAHILLEIPHTETKWKECGPNGHPVSTRKTLVQRWTSVHAWTLHQNRTMNLLSRGFHLCVGGIRA